MADDSASTRILKPDAYAGTGKQPETSGVLATTSSSSSMAPMLVERLSDAVLVPHIQALRVRAAEHAEHDKAPRTLATYAWAWDGFDAWCARRGLPSLPTTPETLRLFVTAAANDGVEPARVKPGRIPGVPKPVGMRTLGIYLAAVAHEHGRAGLEAPLDDPMLRRTLKGLRRDLGRPPVKKAILSEEQLRDALAGLPDTLAGLRDRAIILVAYASGGRRRSEVVGLMFENLRLVQDGYVWTLGQTKTKGAGSTVPIPKSLGTGSVLPSPVGALDAWLKASDITRGPVFRPVGRYSDVRATALGSRAVADVMKAAAIRLGLDERFISGHSLRASFITNSVRAGHTLDWIKMRSLHESYATLYGYIREAKLFDDEGL